MAVKRSAVPVSVVWVVFTVASISHSVLPSVQAAHFLPEHALGGSFAESHPELVPTTSASSTAYTLDVPLNHFNKKDTRTFPDHYYIDDSCWDRKKGPIFVEMGGEGPCGGAHCSAVHQHFGAMAVSVEHRFYGQSIPFNNRNVSMLQYLSVEQNLADTAEIIQYIMRNRSLSPEDHTVIVFGGSYSGATSAWFRMTYPNIAHASISSSGVVNAIVNFTGFDEQVAEAIELPQPGCAAALKQHVQILESYFDKGEKAKVKKRFGAGNLVGTQLGDPDFWYMVADAGESFHWFVGS